MLSPVAICKHLYLVLTTENPGTMRHLLRLAVIITQLTFSIDISKGEYVSERKADGDSFPSDPLLTPAHI